MEAESILDKTISHLPNEAELIIQAKTDDRAFELLYNHYFPKVYGYVFKRIGQKEAAEDIVSTAFLKIFTNLGDYKPGQYNCSFSAWIYRIVGNTLIDHYRKKSRTHENVDLEAIAEPEDGNQDVFEEVARSSERAMMHKLIEELPDNYKKAIELKYFAELSNIEIAEVLDISTVNVGVLLHRALKKIQELHQKYA